MSSCRLVVAAKGVYIMYSLSKILRNMMNNWWTLFDTRVLNCLRWFIELARFHEHSLPSLVFDELTTSSHIFACVLHTIYLPYIPCVHYIYPVVSLLETLQLEEISPYLSRWEEKIFPIWKITRCSTSVWWTIWTKKTKKSCLMSRLVCKRLSFLGYLSADLGFWCPIYLGSPWFAWVAKNLISIIGGSRRDRHPTCLEIYTFVISSTV